MLRSWFRKQLTNKENTMASEQEKRTSITQQEIAQAIGMAGSIPLEQVSDMLQVDYQVILESLRAAGYCSKCG
jgi:hypothetical protein